MFGHNDFFGTQQGIIIQDVSQIHNYLIFERKCRYPEIQNYLIFERKCRYPEQYSPKCDVKNKINNSEGVEPQSGSTSSKRIIVNEILH
jgi:hypothetical protein